MMKFPIYGNIKAMFQTTNQMGIETCENSAIYHDLNKKNTNENDGLNNKHGIFPAIMES